MYEQILVPTDGSEGGQQTIGEAITLAELTGATIHGLYVIDTRDYSTLPESKWLTIEDELEADGDRALDTVRQHADHANIDVTTELTRGIPHEEILTYAADHNIDLIVMGTHGRTGLNRFLIGSVTEKVIRSADIPVLVVRIKAADSTDGDG